MKDHKRQSGKNDKIKAKQPEEAESIAAEPIKIAQLAEMYFNGQISLFIYNAMINLAENARIIQGAR